MLGTALISGFGLGSIYGLIALGFTLTFSVSGTVNFAQGSSVMLGAVLCHTLYVGMDGRSHPRGEALNPTWLGHSVGRWEGDTLVVDVVGYNEGNWIDMVGDPHTDRLHLVERFTRKDLYTLRYEATIDDPGAYTEP